VLNSVIFFSNKTGKTGSRLQGNSADKYCQIAKPDVLLLFVYHNILIIHFNVKKLRISKTAIMQRKYSKEVA